MRKPRVIDLFAGFGGASEGARLAGCEVVAAYELNPVAAGYHHQNHPGCRTVLADVTRVDWRAEAMRLGQIDLLMASPPCQGHSVAGRPARKNGGFAQRHWTLNNAAFAVVAAVRSIKPRAFLLENVPGWTKWDRWEEFVGALKNLGYGVRLIEHACWEYGAPTSRPRLAVIGVRGGEGAADGAALTAEAMKRERPVPFRGCIRDEEGVYSPLGDGARQRPLASRTRHVVQRGLEEIPGDYFLLPYYSEGSGLNPRSVDLPIPTLTRKARWALVHPDKGLRMLSARESMRAMGFREDYIIPEWRGKPNTKGTLELVGNAVPPIAQQQLVTAIIDQL
jgi:site-specific DNA-cytosine methylase